MKNMILIIIPMVGLFLTLFSVYNCGADEKQSSQLLPLLALGLLADGNLEGQVCDIDSDCAWGWTSTLLRKWNGDSPFL
ncbi:hypothetical protein [Leptospira meyeri]|uniref:hypothetical protein n=1 Tax=Leptospira meyeri TaxID=29508 RepID=UPI001FF0077E|nr:hypothetical protein [Leptospira meyeri]